MRSWYISWPAVASMLLSGCASAPNFTQSYYLPKAETTVTATAVIACNSRKIPIAKFVLADPTTYVADFTAPERLNFEDLSGPFSSSNATIELTNDGRLSSINASVTGNGAKDISTAVSIAAAALTIATYRNGHNSALDQIIEENASIKDQKYFIKRHPEIFSKACSSIKSIGKGKPIRIKYIVENYYNKPISYPKYNSSTRSPKLNAVYSMTPDTFGQILPSSIFRILPRIKLVISEYNPKGDPIATNIIESHPALSKQSNAPAIVVRPVIPYLFEIKGGGGDPIDVFNFRGTGLSVYDARYHHIFDANVRRAPYTAMTYAVPIPKAEPFGTETLALSVAPSGAIIKIGYNATPGVGDALSSGSDILKAVQSYPTQRAAYLKSETAKIAAAEKLVACKSASKNCS